MKGFAMLGLNKVGWIEKERPVCGPLDAIIRPLALSPCTSDIHTVWEGALGDKRNMILGHEGCGEVVEVGSLVKDFKPGDKILVAAITPDWNSLEAQGGYSMHSGGMLCGWKFSNIKDGVFGEYFHVNDADGNLCHMPKEVKIEEAPILSDMVPTGFHGAELADIQYGDSVLVIGIGPVGLMSVAASQLRGASNIITVGSRQRCKDVAKIYGANEFISYKDGSISEQVLDLTSGKGVDKVIIAGGDNDSFDEAVRCVKAGGKIGNVNYLGSGTYVKIPRLEWGVGMGHKLINGGLMPGGRLRLQKLSSLVKYNRLDLSHLLTHKFNGFEHVEDALYLMKDKPADLIKPVVII